MDENYSILLAIDSLEQCIKNNNFDIITKDRIKYSIEIFKRIMGE